MILVTGATGHLGKGVIDFLVKKIPANNIAALVRDESKAVSLKEAGVDIRIGNYDDYNPLVKAFTGIDKLLLVSSNDEANRAGQHISAVNAAKEAGVKHIFYTSVNYKVIDHSAIDFVTSAHLVTEDHIITSGLAYTFFANNLYADVLPLFFGEHVLDSGIVFPAGEGKVPFASRTDMAEAIANVLAAEGHENKTYVLASDTSYSISDAAQYLSELSGKEVTYTSPSKEDYISGLVAAGMPEGFASFFAAFATAMKNGEFYTGQTDLEKLLGRKPQSLKEYLRAFYFPAK